VNDQRVAAVMRASRVYRAGDALVRSLEAAWHASVARSLFSRPPLERVRFWSIAALTASATTLALAPLGTDPMPLAWLVPSMCALVSSLIVVSSSR